MNHLALVLDAIALAVIICDAESRVIYANTAARSLQRLGLQVRMRTPIAAATARETRAIARRVHEAATGGVESAFRLTANDIDIFAFVVPLDLAYSAPLSDSALIVARWPREQLTITTDSLKSLFGLSPTQAELALAIFKGQSLATFAKHRNIKLTTVRTHLSEIFAKTGARTQSDIVRLLAALPPVRAPQQLERKKAVTA